MRKKSSIINFTIGPYSFVDLTPQRYFLKFIQKISNSLDEELKNFKTKKFKPHPQDQRQ
jgi:hypothetical protein